MKYEYPIKLDAKAIAHAGALHSTASDAQEDQAPTGALTPLFTVTSSPLAAQECKEWVLAQIANWPEIKVGSRRECQDTMFGRICADVPAFYNRTCTKYVYVDVCYPTGVWADVEECLKGSAVAGAVAAVIASPQAGAAAFEVTLKGCLAAKGKAWADQVRVSGGWRSKCGDWH
jgi:hypothetical protein